MRVMVASNVILGKGDNITSAQLLELLEPDRPPIRSQHPDHLPNLLKRKIFLDVLQNKDKVIFSDGVVLVNVDDVECFQDLLFREAVLIQVVSCLLA